MNKQKMVREVGRRTRLKNREVQAVIEALVDVWTEALANGERIELEGFCVLSLRSGRVTFRAGQRLRGKLNSIMDGNI
jgi:nucleoid DNA-binding protein